MENKDLLVEDVIMFQVDHRVSRAFQSGQQQNKGRGMCGCILEGLTAGCSGARGTLETWGCPGLGGESKCNSTHGLLPMTFNPHLFSKQGPPNKPTSLRKVLMFSSRLAGLKRTKLCLDGISICISDCSAKNTSLSILARFVKLAFGAYRAV
ncbi:hypothetical protein FQN60_004581 [Etheostoma spectabile]|uniref:Uncharacterized protein n=1 Tax=Etheostoma spectabile TaxID=54343 RepID=A0A5J5DK18_9PERO|nr:hypothetical protein FQN60_004581 [Etheostoma spectabile]